MELNKIMVLVKLGLLYLYVTVLLFKGETINKQVWVDYCFDNTVYCIFWGQGSLKVAHILLLCFVTSWFTSKP
jgi:hypothetical protein